MKKIDILGKMSRTLRRTGLKLKKHSPEILLVTGIAGTVAATIVACKSTTKLDTILDDSSKQIDMIHTAQQNGSVENKSGEIVSYSEEDGKKDLVIVRTQTALKLAKLYAPAALLEALSITGIVASHVILHKRYTAVTIAYTGLGAAYAAYRSRVADRFGEDVERDIHYNTHEVTVKEKVTDKKGKVTEVEVTKKAADSNMKEPYARIFDESNPNWDKSATANLMWLHAEQNYANDILKSRGHLFLNEVYDRLGFKRTPAGAVVGWIYDPDNPNSIGDNYVDFGIYDGYVEHNEYEEDDEPYLVLNFNPDGVIYEMI